MRSSRNLRWSMLQHSLQTADSPHGEAFFLWCFRQWVQGLVHNRVKDWDEVWNECARRFGPEDGRQLVSAVARLVNLVRAHATADFSCFQPCCPCRSVEEAALLDVVAAAGCGQGGRAVSQVSTFLRQDAVPETLETASRISAVLGRRDLKFAPAREATAESPGTTTATFH